MDPATDHSDCKFDSFTDFFKIILLPRQTNLSPASSASTRLINFIKTFYMRPDETARSSL